MQNLLLLHGAIGAAAQLQPLANHLGDRFTVHCLDFTGHGGRAMGDEPFSMRLFADDVLQYMDEKGLDSASMLGYSMGGYVAIYLAKHHPEKIIRVVTLATKYQWDEAIAAKEMQMLNPEKIEQKIPAFAAALRERHHPNDWKEVLKKTAEMMHRLGAEPALKTEDYAAIHTPALLLLGDRDKMVTLEETVAVYKALPNARMGMLPGTAHPIEQVDMAMLAYVAGDFLRK